MLPLLPKLEELSNMHRGADLASHLLVYAGTKSFVLKERNCDPDTLPFNRPADDLLLSILKRVKGNDTFDHKKLFEVLEPRAMHILIS
jgi:hypothetical protein